MVEFKNLLGKKHKRKLFKLPWITLCQIIMTLMFILFLCLNIIDTDAQTFFFKDDFRNLNLLTTLKPAKKKKNILEVRRRGDSKLIRNML